LVDLAAEYCRDLNAITKPARTMHFPEKLGGDYEQKIIVAFLAQLNLSATIINEALDEVLDEDAISETQVYRILKAVRDRDEEIFVDHRRSGESGAVRERPVSGNSKNIKEVEKHLADDPHISTRVLATRTGLSRKVVRTILEQLGKVNKFGEFVPGTLDDTTKQQRISACTENLSLLEKDASLLKKVIAEDECWLYTYQERAGEGRRQWCSVDEPPRPEPHQKLHEAKTMLVLFFDHHGPLVINFVPQEQRINSDYYCERLDGLDNAYLSRDRRHKHRGLLLIHDGATSHTSIKTKEHLRKLDLKTLQHPPYSPDISPCDYAVFGPLKKMLRGKHFATLQALQDEATRILKEEFKPEFYKKAIFDLKKRWQTVKRDGEYLTHSRLNAAHYEHHDK